MPIIRRRSGIQACPGMWGGGAAPAPFALDGSAHANDTDGNVSASLTTTYPGIVIAVVGKNGGGVGSNTVISGGGLTWVERAKSEVGNDNISLHYAVSAAPIVATSFTATASGGDFITIDIFGISGADTSTIWDPNGALPDFAKTNTDRSITTSNANDFLISCLRGSTESGIASDDWTLVSFDDYQRVQYRIVTATQSGLNVPTDGYGANGSIADAVMMA